MDHYKRMVRQNLDPKGSIQQERDVADGDPHKPVEVEGEIVAIPGDITDWVIEDAGKVGIASQHGDLTELHIVTEGSVGLGGPNATSPSAQLNVETGEVTHAEETPLPVIPESGKLEDIEVPEGYTLRTAEFKPEDLVKVEEKPAVAVKPKKKKTPAKKKSTVKKKKSTKKA